MRPQTFRTCLAILVVTLFLSLLPLMAQSPTAPGIPIDTRGQDQKLVIVDQGEGAAITVKIYEAAGVAVPSGVVSPGKDKAIVWQWPLAGCDQLNARQTVELTFSNFFQRGVYLPNFFGSVVVEADKPVLFEVRPVNKFGGGR